MKRGSSHKLIIAVAVVAACSRDPAGPPGIPRELTPQEQRIAGNSQGFGFALLREVGKSLPNDNLMLSPLSVSMALGMAANGAEGSTYDEMRDLLGYGQLTHDEVNAAYRGLLEQLRLRDERVQFTIANSVWYRNTFTVEPTFLAESRDAFHAEVRALDFNASNAPSTINDWVSRETGGRIKDLISQINPLDVMFLINAIYFKAPWTEPFEKQSTAAGAFTRDDGSSVTAQLMHQDGTFNQYIGSDVKLVELLYADSAYSMVLALPVTGTVNALVQSLTTEKWQQWLGQLHPGRIMLTLPRFEYRSGDELKQELQALGMKLAFDPDAANFDRINPNQQDLYVSSVIHKTYISVDEEGTEAAAATSVTMGVTSMPPTIQFTRPFFFAIRERSTGTILFTGILRDPARN